MLWCESVAPFGKAVVPDVNWMLIGSSNCNWGESSAMRLASAAPPRSMISEKRNVPGCQLSPMRMTEFRRQLAEHADVIRGLELFGEDERLATDFGQRVFEFGDAVGRIDIDQDEARFGGGELGQHPLAIVGRPDADAVAGIKSECQKSGGQLVGGCAQFAVTQAHLLMPDHQRRPRGPFRAGLVKKFSDGLADERLIARTVNIAERRSGHA